MARVSPYPLTARRELYSLVRMWFSPLDSSLLTASPRMPERARETLCTEATFVQVGAGMR